MNPSIERMDVTVTCACGEETEFDNLQGDDLGSMISAPCDACGMRIEISVDGYVQMVVGS